MRTDRRTDRWTDMTKLIVAFRKFAQTPINAMSIITVQRTSYLAGIQLLLIQVPRTTLPFRCLGPLFHSGA